MLGDLLEGDLAPGDIELDEFDEVFKSVNRVAMVVEGVFFL